MNRLDGVVTDRIKVFYLHNYNDDSSTGGSLRSPFQNVDWTNTHVIGANITGTKLTHAIRLGYVNFNNRIESQELSAVSIPDIERRCISGKCWRAELRSKYPRPAANVSG